MTTTEVVATEVAELEYERFLDAMDLAEKLEARKDDEERKPIEDARHTILRAIGRGTLVISDKGLPIFTPQLEDRTPITFREPSGADLMAIGNDRKADQATQMFRIMASMTEQPPHRYAKMPMRDLRVCQAVTTLLLA